MSKRGEREARVKRLGVAAILPQAAREALQRAAQSGSQVLLDQTLTQLRRRYPQHFKPLETI